LILKRSGLFFKKVRRVNRRGSILQSLSEDERLQELTYDETAGRWIID